MIKHHVDNYAGYRYIKPKRQRPARNAPVPDEVSARGAVKRDEYQRHDNDGQNCMREQECEIERPHESLTRKLRCAVVVVISEIRNEEQRRGNYRCDLAVSMRLDAAAPNETETREQQ